MAMVHIPHNIQELVSYKPGKPVAQIIEELSLEETAILWNNENNLGASPLVAQAVAKAAEHLHLYPDPSARELCSKIAKLNACEVDQVTVDNGSESIFDCMFRAFFEGDDELLTCEGTFVAVYIWAKSNKVPVKKIQLGAGYRFDINGLIASVTPKTKAIYVANPNNPTGAMISQADLEQLIDGVPEHVLIIVDEAYFEYAQALSPDYPDSFKLRAKNVITLRTFSKAYGIAGMRVGYALGPAPLIEAIRKVRMTFAPSNIAQAAALAALDDPEHVAQTIALNTKALQEFSMALHDGEFHYIPSFGNFIMVDMQSEEAAAQFIQAMLERGVFIRQLKAFGLPHCVRISTGTEAENALFIKQLSSLS
jgi:histidinol-phosphate aminotransferase